jgi:hypothetical protein
MIPASAGASRASICRSHMTLPAAGRALGLKAHSVHVPSDLIAAYDPDAAGSLTGEKANSSAFDNSKFKARVPDFRCTVPRSVSVLRSSARFETDPDRQTSDDRLNTIQEGRLPQ